MCKLDIQKEPCAVYREPEDVLSKELHTFRWLRRVF